MRNAGDLAIDLTEAALEGTNAASAAPARASSALPRPETTKGAWRVGTYGA
jgi:hypothetical protein